MTTVGPPEPDARGGDGPTPLSPDELAVLTGIEDGLRSADPALAEALSRPATPAVPAFPLSGRQVALLVTALSALCVGSAVFGDRLGTAGTALFTVLVVVPWLVCAARAARHRPTDGAPSARPGGKSFATRHRGRLLVLATAVGLTVTSSPTASAVLGLVVAFVVVPFLVLHTFRHAEQRFGGEPGPRAPRRP